MQLDSVGDVDAAPRDGFVSARGHDVGTDRQRRLERARDATLQHVAG